MRMIFGLVLLLGVGLAGFAVYMAKDYINANQAQLAEARKLEEQIVPVTEVFVVNKQVRYGQTLSPEDVASVRWPTAGVPEGSFTSLEELFPNENKEPRAVVRMMEKGEAVLATKVTEPGEDAGVRSRLSPGMRAFTIRTDVTTGVGGFLRPGDRVDVYWTGSVGGGAGITQLIDANIRIIAINQSADEDRSGPTVAQTVTVEVDPGQVAALAQAQATGRLSLSLVGADDTFVSADVKINQRDLLGIEEQVVVEAERKKVCTVKTRKGAEEIITQVDCPEEEPQTN